MTNEKDRAHLTRIAKQWAATLVGSRHVSNSEIATLAEMLEPLLITGSGIPPVPELEARYLYHFFVWPDETRGRADLDNDGNPVPQAVFKLFETINHNIEMEFTPLEFVRFRHDVESFGLTLREISRVPYQEEETVL